MMQRLFTFGCSFTKNNYPTWADIVGTQFSYYQNWAQPGAGNTFIFYSLVECMKRNTICADDTVIIMWTSIAREDRYTRNNKWITPGSIFNQTVYNKTFVDNFSDISGYLIRDLALISAVLNILSSIGCKYYFLSTVPLALVDDNNNNLIDLDSKIVSLYNREIKYIRTSVYEHTFKKNWFYLPGKIDLNSLEIEYKNCAGPDWPSWQRFLNQDYSGVPKKIINEIHNKYDFQKKLLIRTDSHPTPMEHLSYLQDILPEISIPEFISDRVEEADQKFKDNIYPWSIHLPKAVPPNRF
jgi:hypothetical protein